MIGNTIDLGSPLQPINGTLTIRPKKDNVCYNLRQASYLTVKRGASLTLEGISVVVNGAESKSVIDNNGGTLTIKARGSSGPCDFSNQLGSGSYPTLGGILHNRANGSANIVSANLVNSAASEEGGAIYIDSGTVSISGGRFNGNEAQNGGAIYVSKNATLNITSSNFSINDNKAGNVGGAISSYRGIVTMQLFGDKTPNSVSIAFNTAYARGGADYGGAIYAEFGQLSIDGMQFLGNRALRGGAISMRNMDTNPASITRSYFRDNSAQSGERGHRSSLSIRS